MNYAPILKGWSIQQIQRLRTALASTDPLEAILNEADTYPTDSAEALAKFIKGNLHKDTISPGARRFEQKVLAIPALAMALAEISQDKEGNFIAVVCALIDKATLTKIGDPSYNLEVILSPGDKASLDNHDIESEITVIKGTLTNKAPEDDTPKAKDQNPIATTGTTGKDQVVTIKESAEGNTLTYYGNEYPVSNKIQINEDGIFTDPVMGDLFRSQVVRTIIEDDLKHVSNPDPIAVLEALTTPLSTPPSNAHQTLNEARERQGQDTGKDGVPPAGMSRYYGGTVGASPSAAYLKASARLAGAVIEARVDHVARIDAPLKAAITHYQKHVGPGVRFPSGPGSSCVLNVDMSESLLAVGYKKRGKVFTHKHSRNAIVETAGRLVYHALATLPGKAKATPRRDRIVKPNADIVAEVEKQTPAPNTKEFRTASRETFPPARKTAGKAKVYSLKETYEMPDGGDVIIESLGPVGVLAYMRARLVTEHVNALGYAEHRVAMLSEDDYGRMQTQAKAATHGLVEAATLLAVPSDLHTVDQTPADTADLDRGWKLRPSYVPESVWWNWLIDKEGCTESFTDWLVANYSDRPDIITLNEIASQPHLQHGSQDFPHAPAPEAIDIVEAVAQAKTRVSEPCQWTEITPPGQTRFIALSAVPCDRTTTLTLESYLAGTSAVPDAFIGGAVDIPTFLTKLNEAMDADSMPDTKAVIAFVPSNKSRVWTIPEEVYAGLPIIYVSRDISESAKNHADWKAPRNPMTVAHQYAHIVWANTPEADRPVAEVQEGLELELDAGEAFAESVAHSLKPEAAGITESLNEDFSMETATKFLVPNKSVLIKNVWWTIQKRDIAKDAVMLRTSDYAIKDGMKAQAPIITKFSTLISNIKSGKWGATIGGKSYGPKQDAEKRDAIRRKAGIKAAPGAADIRAKAEGKKDESLQIETAPGSGVFKPWVNEAGSHKRTFKVDPVSLEGDAWKVAYDVTPSKNFPGAYTVDMHQTKAQTTVRLTPTGKVKIVSAKWYKLRVKITPVGDGEPDGESFAGWAMFKEPPFGYDDDGKISESETTPAVDESTNDSADSVQDVMVNKKIPAVVEPGKAIIVKWADGRGILAFGSKKALAAWFNKARKEGDPEIVWIHYEKNTDKLDVLNVKDATDESTLDESIASKIEGVSAEAVEKKFPPVTTVQDWGSNKGQGKRSGGMVKGAMGDPPRGKKAYIDKLGSVADLPKDDRTSLQYGAQANLSIMRYLKARTAGFSNEAAMTYVALTDVPGEFTAEEIEARMKDVKETCEALENFRDPDALVESVTEWLHGDPVKRTTFDGQKMDRDRGSQNGGNENGPGIYWTSQPDEAEGYGKFIHTAKMKVSKARLLTDKTKATPKLVTALIMACDKTQREDALQNWAETTEEALPMAVKAYVGMVSFADAAVAIYHDIFGYESDPWAAAMVKIGFDAYTPSSRPHFIVYNPKVIDVTSVREKTVSEASVKLTAAETKHANIIAAWLVVMDVNSSGGQGVALKNEKPASVAFPDVAKDYEKAKDALGWTYTKLPFDVARRMSSIPNEAAWKAKRKDAGDPPLMDADKAMAIHKHIKAAMTTYGEAANGYGNAASGRVIAALKKGGDK